MDAYSIMVRISTIGIMFLFARIYNMWNGLQTEEDGRQKKKCLYLVTGGTLLVLSYHVVSLFI